MKKQTVAIAWAVVILLIVVCSVVFYLRSSIADTAKAVDEKAVFECMSSDIVGYSVARPEYSYGIEKTEDGWIAVDNEEARLDEKKTGELLKYASLVLSNGTLKAAELDGFDKSKRARTEVKLKDSSVHGVEFIGEKDGECAFRVSDDDTVYKMSVSTRDVLIGPLDNIRKTEVFEDLSGIEKELTEFSFRENSGRRVRVRMKTGDELKSGENKFLLIEPYVWEADDEKVIQQLAVNIPGLKKVKFLGADEDLERYGLNRESRSELAFTAGGREYALYLGKNDGGIVYAMSKGRNDIFAINSKQLEFLGVESFYLIETDLIQAEADELDAVRVVAGDEVYELRRRESGGATEYSINGAEMNGNAFSIIADAVSELEITGMVKEAPKGDAAIKLRAVSGAYTVNAELIPYGDKSYAIIIDNEARFTVDKAEIDEIINKFRESVKNPIKAKTEKEGKD